MTKTRPANRPLRLDDRAALDAAVADHDALLVEFYTNGCGKCQALEPVLGLVARATDVPIAMINARETLSLVDELGMRGVPTLVLFRDGDPVDQLFGYQDPETLVEFVSTA